MPNKIERFEARLTESQKELFLKATVLGGHRSLTEFIINSAQEKANHLISEEKTIHLVEKDQELFFDALLNPPKPNKKLKQAAKRFLESN